MTNRFVGTPSDFVISQCFHCTHYRGREDGGVDTCGAFPAGIPRDVLINRVMHTSPIDGDHGLQYKLKDGMQPPPSPKG